VVAVVVDLHRLRVDVRLERVERVGKIREFEGHAVTICSTAMATLAYSFEEIGPRELRPELYELDGISRASVEAHYRLYQGYVNKRNEILGRLAEVELGTANQVYSDLRALKIDLTFAIGGIKNHELYFAHLGGGGGDPTGAFGSLVRRDFGSIDAWRSDLRATGLAARGWAWTAYDWDEGRLFNYIGDAQNTFPVWNATPLVALDVYEHAYFIDYQTDRGAYIDAFFGNLDWDVVDGWVEQHAIPA
jgi:Fe-Mn family superoxide dismutase